MRSGFLRSDRRGIHGGQSLSGLITHTEPLRGSVWERTEQMRLEDASTCGGTEGRRALLGLGQEPTVSGAEGSSSRGLYVPGVRLREQKLKGEWNEPLTSEDALFLRGPADVKVWVINWVVPQELWDT